MAATAKTSLRGLRTFCVAARLNSFRLAGEELFITSSAVSHQVKSLEQELGITLFDRNARELSLTEVGKAFFEEMNPLIAGVDEVAGRYRNSGPKRTLRISVQPFFASELFVPRLSEFTRQHPEIDIQVGTSDESSEKHPSNADMSIRLFKSAPENLVSHRLFPLRMVPAASPAFKKAMRVKGKKITSDFPLIVHEAHPKAWRRWAKATGIGLPEAGKVTRLDSMIAVVRAAEQGIGAAMVPVPMADQWFRQGSIARLFDSELVSELTYFLVYREERGDEPAIGQLRDWVLENLADLG